MTHIDNNDARARTNQDAVVQALIEGARLAGATLVQVRYESDADTLFVYYEGSTAVGDIASPLAVLKDFRSATYTEVRIASGDRELKLLRKDLLAVEADAAQARDGLVTLEGTSVTLNGFNWPDAGEKVKAMTHGSTIPVSFSGVPSEAAALHV